MSQVVAVTEAAAIGIHAVLLLTMRRNEALTAGAIAAELQVSENHCVKVMQRLAHGGIVAAVRGPKGGFHLAADPEQLTLMQVYELIDGPMVDKHCLFKVSKCPASQCVFNGLTGQINQLVRGFLQSNTFASVVGQVSEMKSVKVLNN